MTAEHQIQEAVRTKMSVDAGFVPDTPELHVTLIATFLARARSLSHLAAQRALGHQI